MCWGHDPQHSNVLGVMYTWVGGPQHIKFMCRGSCIYVLGVMHKCVEGDVFMCWGSCICVFGVTLNVLGVMYLCVDPQHINVLTPMHLCVGVMYLYANGGHVFVCWGSCIYVTPRSCINVLGVNIYVLTPTHKCVGGHV